MRATPSSFARAGQMVSRWRERLQHLHVSNIDRCDIDTDGLTDEEREQL